ncbi:G protein-coupled receptor 184 [Scleropages formosus]|uniref:G protein-coupled receptor 184 n=1 Tax=Scleropages formosus TaxID=113540 RepID=A0A8C9U9I5_SCLFO|nr:G-protein coupled receptor 4-like [Scleropages formosus]
MNISLHPSEPAEFLRHPVSLHVNPAQRPAQTMNNHTVNKTCVDLSDSSSGDLLMTIYILAFVLGVITNLFTLGPIVQQVRSHNVLGVYLLSLAFSDLLYIFTMPVWIYYYHNHHHWNMSPWTCQLSGFFFYSNMYISIGLLCCISIDRCLTVSYPLQARTVRSSRYALIISAFVGLVVMTIHCLILIFDTSYPLDENKRCYEHYPMPLPVARFNLIRASLGFLCPLLVLAVCYWQIIRKVRHSEGVDQKAKQKVRRLSVAVIAIFSICFAPYHFLLTVRSLAAFYMPMKDYCHFEENLHFFFSCALAVSSLNSVMDPVLYVLSSDGVKKDIRLCLVRLRRGKLETKSFATNHVQLISSS